MASIAAEGFTEFVVARGPSLHRTAILLTGHESEADDLVETALMRAWRAWPRIRTEHEARVRQILVRAYVRSRRRGGGSETPTEDPRRRAVIVLRFFDEYTEARTAEALGCSVGVVRSHTATALARPWVGDQVDTLRTALAEEADRSAPPDTDSLLERVASGVAAARRRRLRGTAALAGVLLLGVGLGAMREDLTRTPPRTAGPPSAAARTVAHDPAFPAYTLGLKRLAILELPQARHSAVATTLPAAPAGRMFAFAHCPRLEADERLVSVSSGARHQDVPCVADPQRWRSENRVVLWRPGEGDRALSVRWAGPAPDGVLARLAVYQEVPWKQYRFPARPPDLATNPATAWPRDPSGALFVGPAHPGRPNAPLTVTVRYQQHLAITVLARAPGTLGVRVNGDPLRLVCHKPNVSTMCPEVPGHAFTTWAYVAAEAGNWVEPMPGLRPGVPVTISVQPTSFAGDDWRLSVDVRRH